MKKDIPLWYGHPGVHGVGIGDKNQPHGSTTARGETHPVVGFDFAVSDVLHFALDQAFFERFEPLCEQYALQMVVLMLDEEGEPWNYEEGCLSIPRIRGEVERPPRIRLRYQDERFEHHEAIFTGINARVIQHEYDHLQGVLFTERLKPLKKRLIQRKMEDIRNGKIKTDYRMRFATSSR